MSRRLLLTTVVLLCCAITVSAAERRYDFREIELDNGMKVISLEDFSCPIVAVQVWYHVGSKNEEPGRQGFAHMFEHMMFRGTDRLNETDHFDNIRRVGGNTNAYTAFDQTVYVEELPANQLEMVLWLEAERMAFLKIDEKGFRTERKVVEEEVRQGHNSPYGRVPERALAEIYGDELYGWTPGGQIEHLRNATIDELQAFWDKFYVPNNATLVVVGAAKHEAVQSLAKKYFGWIPRCADPVRPVMKPNPQKKPRTIKIPEDRGPVPIIGVLYRTVPQAHPDALPLQIAMGIMGGGESSRLYIDVVKEKKIAEVAMAMGIGFENDGLAAAGGALLPLVGDKAQLIKTIKKHIKRIRNEPVTEAELTKMKNQLRRQAVSGAMTVASKAGLLGQYAVLEGDAEKINRQLDEIDAVTIADIQRVANTYLTKAHRMNILVEPSVGGFFKGLFKGEEKPAEETPLAEGENRVAKRTGPKATAKRPKWFPTEPPTAQLIDDIPEIAHTEKTLSNGLRVVVVSNHEVPMVSMMLGFRSGAWTEQKPGTANIAMSMLTKGTKTRDARKLAELLESNAISLSGSAGMDTALVNASALLPQLDLAAELFSDVVRNPIFPKDELDILRKQMRLGLMIQTKTPEYQADRQLRQTLFGNHPYARTTTGELEDVDAVRIDDLRSWWAEHLRPENAVLYVSGDINSPDAFKLAEKHLASWKVKTPFEPIALPKLPEPNPTQIYLVDRPGSVQSQIRVGHVSLTRRSPDYFVATVLSNIFGGGFNSRLNRAIRVEKGLTYGARGGIRPRRFAGQLTISTFTKTPTTADTVRAILEEIDKIQSAPPTAKEVVDTKTYLSGKFPGDRETPAATVGDLWMIETQDLPDDYLRNYLRGIQAVTGEGVQHAAGNLIDTSHMAIVVVGEAKVIKADLEKIAPVKVIGEPTDTASTPQKEPERTSLAG